MTQALFLSPHNDDETLFGAHVLQRYKPLVVVCLRSWRMSEPGYPGNRPVNFPVREAETKCAMDVLGCEWRQLDHLDLEPVDWDRVGSDLIAIDREIEPGLVFAPAMEPEGGNAQHDRLGQLARSIFRLRMIPYLTYRYGHRDPGMIRGERIAATPVEMRRKVEALACYTSQREHPVTAHHFDAVYDEYLLR